MRGPGSSGPDGYVALADESASADSLERYFVDRHLST